MKNRTNILLIVLLSLSFLAGKEQPTWADFAQFKADFYDPQVVQLVYTELNGDVTSVATDAEVSAAVAGGTYLATDNQTLDADRTVSGNSLHTFYFDALDSLMIESAGLGASIFDVRGFNGMSMTTPGAFALTSTVGQVNITSGSRSFSVSPTAHTLTGIAQHNGDTVLMMKPDGTLFYSVPGGDIQTHTAGTTLTVDVTTETVYIDPATVLSELTITLPTPSYNKVIEFHFGGTITAGDPVVLDLNLPTAVLAGEAWTGASSGDGFSLRYNTNNSKYYFK